MKTLFLLLAIVAYPTFLLADPVTITGEVTSPTGDPLNGVLIRVEVEDTGQQRGRTVRTGQDGKYTITIEEVTVPIIVDFNPKETNNAPDSVRLLAGEGNQVINKVLRIGGLSYPVFQRKDGGEAIPIVPDESNSNKSIRDAMSKLSTFEQYEARLLQTGINDEFDREMRNQIIDYLKTMPPPMSLVGDSDHNKALLTALRSLRARVFQMYGVPNIISVGNPAGLQCPSVQHDGRGNCIEIWIPQRRCRRYF